MNTTYPLSWRLTQAVINYKISELARVSCPHCRSTFNAVSTHREIAPTLGNLKKLPLRGHKACLRRNLKDHENNISPRLRGFATPTGATLREYRALTAVPHSRSSFSTKCRVERKSLAPPRKKESGTFLPLSSFNKKPYLKFLILES